MRNFKDLTAGENAGTQSACTKSTPAEPDIDIGNEIVTKIHVKTETQWRTALQPAIQPGTA